MVETIKTYLEKFTPEQLSQFDNEQLFNFRKLPEVYKVDQIYTYKLIKRGLKCALYEGYYKDQEKPSIYEVFMIKISKPMIVKMQEKMVFVPTREKVPSNEDFGKFALSIIDKDYAEKIYEAVELGQHINQI